MSAAAAAAAAAATTTLDTPLSVDPALFPASPVVDDEVIATVRLPGERHHLRVQSAPSLEPSKWRLIVQLRRGTKVYVDGLVKATDKDAKISVTFAVIRPIRMYDGGWSQGYVKRQFLDIPSDSLQFVTPTGFGPPPVSATIGNVPISYLRGLGVRSIPRVRKPRTIEVVKLRNGEQVLADGLVRATDSTRHGNEAFFAQIRPANPGDGTDGAWTLGYIQSRYLILEGGVKLDILPCNEQANKSADDTFEMDAPVIGTISNVPKRYLRGLGVRSRPRISEAEDIRIVNLRAGTRVVVDGLMQAIDDGEESDFAKIHPIDPNETDWVTGFVRQKFLTLEPPETKLRRLDLPPPPRDGPEIPSMDVLRRAMRPFTELWIQRKRITTKNGLDLLAQCISNSNDYFRPKGRSLRGLRAIFKRKSMNKTPVRDAFLKIVMPNMMKSSNRLKPSDSSDSLGSAPEAAPNDEAGHIPTNIPPSPNEFAPQTEPPSPGHPAYFSADEFFKSDGLLHYIVTAALELADQAVRCKDLNFLRELKKGEKVKHLSLPRKLCCSFLANMFLCTLVRPSHSKTKTHSLLSRSRFNDCNMKHLLTSKMPHNVAKLRMILNYFDRNRINYYECLVKRNKSRKRNLSMRSVTSSMNGALINPAINPASLSFADLLEEDFPSVLQETKTPQHETKTQHEISSISDDASAAASAAGAADASAAASAAGAADASAAAGAAGAADASAAASAVGADDASAAAGAVDASATIDASDDDDDDASDDDESYDDEDSKAFDDIPGYIHIFRQRCDDVREELVDCELPLLPMKVAPDLVGFEDPKHGADLMHVDYANKYIGGKVLQHGLAQEEIRFSIAPELLVSMLFCEVMSDEESIQIVGAERFSNYAGYGFTLQYAGDYHDDSKHDDDGTVLTSITAMDALNGTFVVGFKNITTQLRYKYMTREVTKASAGLRPASDYISRFFPAVGTGNWGCGVFGGCAHLKALIQWVAASSGGIGIKYFPFDLKGLGPALRELSDELTGYNKVKVCTLWAVLCEFSQMQKLEPQKLKRICRNRKTFFKSVATRCVKIENSPELSKKMRKQTSQIKRRNSST